MEVPEWVAVHARAIGLHLKEFCDESASKSYYEMLGEASRKAKTELDRLRAENARLLAILGEIETSQNANVLTSIRSVHAGPNGFDVDAEYSTCACCLEKNEIAHWAIAGDGPLELHDTIRRDVFMSQREWWKKRPGVLSGDGK